MSAALDETPSWSAEHPDLSSALHVLGNLQTQGPSPRAAPLHSAPGISRVCPGHRSSACFLPTYREEIESARPTTRQERDSGQGASHPPAGVPRWGMKQGHPTLAARAQGCRRRSGPRARNRGRAPLSAAPPRAGGDEGASPKPSPPRPLRLPLGQEVLGGPALDAQARRTEHGAQRPGQRTVGAPAEARRPAPPEKGSGNAGGAGSQPPGRPGGRPPPPPARPRRLCGAPAPGSAEAPARDPAGHLSASAPCSRRRRGSDLLYRPSPRIARRALALSRSLGGTGRDARAGALTEAGGPVSVPRPGCRGSNAGNQRPARGTTSVPCAPQAWASTGRPSRSLVCGRAPPNGGLLEWLSCSPD